VRDNRDHPSILQKLFPRHPARRLLCTDIHCDDSGKVKKEVTTRHRGALLGAYNKHLDPKSHIDLDRITNLETGEISERGKRIISMFPGAYKEISPSGSGVSSGERLVQGDRGIPVD
jgi:hypothetical protein